MLLRKFFGIEGRLKAEALRIDLLRLEIFAYAYEKPRQDRQSLQTDPVGYEDDFNLYAYVANDPLNRTDPTGLCDTEITGPEGESYAAPGCETFGTVFASANSEAIVGADGGGGSVGVFASADEDSITLGWFTQTRDPVAGVPADIGVAGAVGFVGGDEGDFEGSSLTQEFDVGSSGSQFIAPGLTGEVGQTASGQPIAAVQAGITSSGTSIGQNETRVQGSVTISGREVARSVQSAPERVRQGLGAWFPDFSRRGQRR